MLETGPASFLGGIGEIGFTGNQGSSLLKCFGDCAPATREKIQKVFGSPSAHPERVVVF